MKCADPAPVNNNRNSGPGKLLSRDDCEIAANRGLALLVDDLDVSVDQL